MRAPTATFWRSAANKSNKKCDILWWGEQRSFPQSHSRAFVDASLSSHLGFTYFVRNIVSFSGCSPFCSSNTHLLGRLKWWNIRLGSFCQTERLENESGWSSRLVFSRWMKYFSFTWLWHFTTEWRRTHNLVYSCNAERLLSSGVYTRIAFRNLRWVSSF